MASISRVVSLTLLFSLSTHGYPSNQPVIGVLLETVLDSYHLCKGQYKVLSDYQSFIEQGGGGVVPVFVNQSTEYYDQLLTRINGVLFTGGGVDLITSPYGKAGHYIYKKVREMNDKGVYFPIWGTCLGMQEMTTWPLSPSRDILSKCNNTEAVSLPLNFTSASKASKLLGGLPNNIADILQNKPVTANYHHFCLAMNDYTSSKQLSSFYSALSTNIDGIGLQFVSTIEARNYPFYGVQWHPEKNNFLHPPGTKINQSLDAILIGQHFGNFLVAEARKNKNRFRSIQEERKFFINSYPSTFDDTFYEYYCLNDSDIPEFDQSN